MTAYQHPELIALDEVEDILDAYAEACLSPSGPLLARMRATVMTRAYAKAAVYAAQAAAAAGMATEPPAGPWYRFSLPSLDGPRWQAPRLVAALGFAVALGLGTSAAVTAAPPGSPFYNARVALEQIMLPTQIDERLAAHEDHLDARLAEAEAAAARGDFVSLDAALAAYRTEVEVALAEVGEDYDRLVILQAVLEKHVVTLNALAARLPTAARDDGLQHALQASQKAVTKVKDKKDQAPNRPSVLPGEQQTPPGGPEDPGAGGPPEPPSRP